MARRGREWETAVDDAATSEGARTAPYDAQVIRYEADAGAVVAWQIGADEVSASRFGVVLYDARLGTWNWEVEKTTCARINRMLEVARLWQRNLAEVHDELRNAPPAGLPKASYAVPS